MKKISFILLLYFLCSNITLGQLTIIVDAIPANTPLGDPIHIAGDFQSWDPGSSAHQLVHDSIFNQYHITLPQGVGTINFKFTRGDWSKVEADQNGNFIPDRYYASNDGDTIYLQILGWEDLNGNGGGQSTATANVTQIDSFYMSNLNRYRRIWIYLPPDYQTSTKDYPVLYMHDGQNVFDAATSFVGEWEVDETLNALHSNGDRGIIVVAVDNGGAKRIDEYSAWVNPNYGGGEGPDYIDFIANELKPYIDNNYRTLSDRDNTGIMGSSLGGLISTYAGVEYPLVFGRIGALSPAYWFNPELFGHVINQSKQHPARFYQLMGSKEGLNNVANMYIMEDSLLQAGFDTNEVISVEKSDGEHSEWFWAREFEAAYLWLFGQNSTDIILKGENLITSKVFPNPTKDQLIVKFYLRNPAHVSLEITDSMGRIHHKVYGNILQQGEHQVNLNLSNLSLSAGNYICTIRNKEEINSIPFIVVE